MKSMIGKAWIVAGVIAAVVMTAGTAQRTYAAEITLGDTSLGNVTAANSLTVAHIADAGANRMLVVGVTCNDNDGTRVTDTTVSSVTYGGVALTYVPDSKRATERATANRTTVELWYLPLGDAANASTADVVVTTAGTADRIAAYALTLIGAVQGEPEAHTATATADGQLSNTHSITTLTDDARIVSFAENGRSGSALLATAPMIRHLAYDNGASESAIGTLVATTPQAYSCTWTASTSGPWAHTLASFAVYVPPSGTVFLLR